MLFKYIVLFTCNFNNSWADEKKSTNWLSLGIDVVPDVSSSTITKIGGNVTKISSQIKPEIDINIFFTSICY